MCIGENLPSMWANERKKECRTSTQKHETATTTIIITNRSVLSGNPLAWQPIQRLPQAICAAHKNARLSWNTVSQNRIYSVWSMLETYFPQRIRKICDWLWENGVPRNVLLKCIFVGFVCFCLCFFIGNDSVLSLEEVYSVLAGSNWY